VLPKWSWTDGIPIIVWFWPTLDMSDHIPFATKNTTQLIGNMVWGFKGCKWIQCSQEDLQSREACDMNLSPCIIPDIMFESSLKILHFSDLTRAYLAALQIGLYMFLHVGSGRAIKTKKMLEVFKKQACADDWIQVCPCVFRMTLCWPSYDLELTFVWPCAAFIWPCAGLSYDHVLMIGSRYDLASFIRHCGTTTKVASLLLFTRELSSLL